MSDALNLRPAWQKVAARLQHEARTTSGYAIISMAGILVDANGNPIMWTEPRMIRLEPKGLCDPEMIIRIFGVDGSGKT